MTYVVLIRDNVVVNTIVADPSDDISAFPSRFGCDEAIDATDLFPRPAPGWTRHNSEWRPPPPHPSWIWTNGAWAAPVTMPDGDGYWDWDEESLSWVDGAI